MKSSEEQSTYLDNQDAKKNKSVEEAISRQVEYNTFIRNYFANPKSEGKKLQDAIDAWNKVKSQSGDKL